MAACIYRVCRQDQVDRLKEQKPIKPRRPLDPGEALEIDENSDRGALLQLVEDHLLNGSAPGYNSAFLSFTSDLDVALAWSVPARRIAEMPSIFVPPSRSVPLNGEWVRGNAGSKHPVALLRAQRSHEVLVAMACSPPSIKLLLPFQVTDIERFSPFPLAIFPSARDVQQQPLSDLVEGEVGGPNHRMTRLSFPRMGSFVIRTPRPNVLHERMLREGELIQMAQHEYACLSAYQALLAGSVPSFCLYKCQVHFFVDGCQKKRSCAFLLLEDFDIMEALECPVQRELDAFHNLLGNWKVDTWGMTRGQDPRYVLLSWDPSCTI